jgi:hypothetical protein
MDVANPMDVEDRFYSAFSRQWQEQVDREILERFGLTTCIEGLILKGKLAETTPAEIQSSCQALLDARLSEFKSDLTKPASGHWIGSVRLPVPTISIDAVLMALRMRAREIGDIVERQVDGELRFFPIRRTDVRRVTDE